MRAVVLGIVLGMSSLSLIYMIGVALDTDTKPEPQTPKSNFAVLDNYKGCDVVQWSYGTFAEYKYFLHCHK